MTTTERHRAVTSDLRRCVPPRTRANIVYMAVADLEIGVRVPVRRHGELVGVALIDPEDADAVQGHSWLLDRGGYAVSGTGTSLKMHRLVAGATKGDGLYVDHINGNRLDNRRANLRVVTPAQSSENRRSLPGSTSRYRGVTRCPDGRWQVQVELNNVHRYLGRFESEDEAGAVAKRWREEHMPFAVDR